MPVSSFRLLLAASLFLVQVITLAQQAPSPFTAPNRYRTKANPWYWLNKPPRPGYWQQDVHYQIEAELDDSLDVITAKSYRLTYWNNSPQTLQELFFHLHENAFQPGSHYHDLWRQNKRTPEFGQKWEQKGLGTTTEDIRVDGRPVPTELDNTVLRVALNEPLLPGDSLTVTMRFRTHFDQGSMRRRMKLYKTGRTKHFDAVHWYPVLAAYDEHRKWNADQHLDKEFYADFGTFDVALTLPYEYVVEATGLLQNEAQALPDTLKRRFDLSNFRQPNSPSATLPKIPGRVKTWVYHAENVHNFAFTADPLYRIGRATSSSGVQCIALAQEQVAHRWQPTARFMAAIIDTYSAGFGPYIWPKIVVADARDGMEYPMLTLCGGTWPSHQGLLAHEMGHMWFYGMLGSNETYRAFLDEGFTQYLTSYGLENAAGQTPTLFRNLSNTRFFGQLYPYIDAVRSDRDQPLNTHSADFNGAIRQGGGYGLVYFKSATMLQHLRYTLGDTAFQSAMRSYVRRWTAAHPYPDDFRHAIQDHTGADLSWFFDQWLEQNRPIDLAVRSVRKGSKPNEYKVRFKRIGPGQTPVRFTVFQQNGTRQAYFIPNDWHLPPDTGLTIRPMWYQPNTWLHPTYTATLNLPSPPTRIQIDTTYQLPDINLANNTWRPGLANLLRTTDIRSWYRAHPYPNWQRGQLTWRPALWYNAIDGLQLGLKLEKGYFYPAPNFSLAVWGNTGLRIFDPRDGQSAARLGLDSTQRLPGVNPYPIAYEAAWDIPTRRLLPFSSLRLHSLFDGGTALNQGTFTREFQAQDESNPRHNLFSATYRSIYTPSLRGYWYLPGQKEIDRFNNYLLLSLARRYPNWHGSGSGRISLRLPGLFSDFSYSYAEAEAKNTFTLGRLVARTRAFVRYGMGNVPVESGLTGPYAPYEEMLARKPTRSAYNADPGFNRYGTDLAQLYLGGGLNLRGFTPADFSRGAFPTPAGEPVSNLNPLSGWGGTRYAHASGWATNLELDYDGLFRRRGKAPSQRLSLQTYLFADMGGTFTWQYARRRGADGQIAPDLTRRLYLLGDAGLGFLLNFTPYFLHGDPVTLRLDVPLITSYTPNPRQTLDRNLIRLSLGRAF